MPSTALARRTALFGYLALSAVDSYLAGREGPGARRARHVTKPLLMPALAATTQLTAGRSRAAAAAAPTTLIRSVQAAQLFSWGGDVALLGRGRNHFLGGVGSFLVAHLCYIAGFVTARDEHTNISGPGVKAAGATWLVAAPIMAREAGRQDPALRIPVAVYAGVLSTMFATSTLLSDELPPRARKRLVAGSSLFLVSDTLLGVQKFLRREHSAVLESAVMATYTVGQLLIAGGAATAND